MSSKKKKDIKDKVFQKSCMLMMYHDDPNTVVYIFCATQF